jgi:hypothetical protein
MPARAGSRRHDRKTFHVPARGDRIPAPLQPVPPHAGPTPLALRPCAPRTSPPPREPFRRLPLTPTRMPRGGRPVPHRKSFPLGACPHALPGDPRMAGHPLPVWLLYHTDSTTESEATRGVPVRLRRCPLSGLLRRRKTRWVRPVPPWRAILAPAKGVPCQQSNQGECPGAAHYAASSARPRAGFPHRATVSSPDFLVDNPNSVVSRAQVVGQVDAVVFEVVAITDVELVERYGQVLLPRARLD